MSGDIDKEIGGLCDVVELGVGKAVNLFAVLVNQGRRVGEAEIFGDVLEIGEIQRVFEGRDRAGRIDTALSVDLLDEVDPKAELLKPKTQSARPRRCQR